MVANLFAERSPTATDAILDPGCGTGHFIAGILRWCEEHRSPVPRIVGVELDRGRCAEAEVKFHHVPSVTIEQRDFLRRCDARFDFVIGNPPYVPITSFSEKEKAAFRANYATARGRFDLYLLFFEQSLRLLKPGGRLVFITPEKFLYVKTAEPLRQILAGLDVREIRLADEETFGELITYPTITTVDNAAPSKRTTIVLRDGARVDVALPKDGSSLLPYLHESGSVSTDGPVLSDVCVRVSCGVATGADSVFVQRMDELSPELAAFAYPTISGRQLIPGQENVRSGDALLVPYDDKGELLADTKLGELGAYLRQHKKQLAARTCAKRKSWFAFHDSVPIDEILRPKLLCKDITAEPAFWIDRKGTIVPRHTVYYLVPHDPAQLDALAAYLNSDVAVRWMRANCQRAANGFIRLQSAILKRLPVPEHLVSDAPRRTINRRRPRARHAALILSRR